MTATASQRGPTRMDRLAQAAPAISGEGIGKAFRLPHQRYSTLKERALHPLARGHDTLHALEDVTFEVKRGEFYGVVGRNGSGKSTLLKCLAGIYGLDRGEIRIDGRLSPFIELGVGFNPELTARDNVLINAIMLGLSRREAKRRFDEIIAFAELEQFIDLKLKNYSSGMAVRLGFSVAIQVDAEVLLVDEVLAVGDVAFQRKCFDEFERMRDSGSTIVFVTHDMNAVERFCDRAMLLEQGRVLAIGAPEEVSQRYIHVNFQRPGEAGDAVPGGAGEARVRSAWVEGEGGERIVTVEQGARCAACMEVEFLSAVEDPMFTIVFHNEVGHVVFIATSASHQPTGRFAAGERAVLRFGFSSVLAPSRYSLSPTVGVWEPELRVIDRRDQAASLLVTGPRENGGVVDLPTDLGIERA